MEIMETGLIATFEGRIIICVVLASLGLILSAILTGVVLVRKAPPLTTQIDRMAGTTQHGIGRWFLGFAAVFCGPALLGVIVVTGIEVTHWIMATPTALPLIALGIGCVAVLWLYARHLWKNRTLGYLPSLPPAPVETAPVPQPGYFLPEPEQHWDQR